jgi:hypothetical protein
MKVSKLSQPRRAAGTPVPFRHGRHDFRGYVALRQIPCRACRNGSLATFLITHGNVGFTPNSDFSRGRKVPSGGNRSWLMTLSRSRPTINQRELSRSLRRPVAKSRKTRILGASTPRPACTR